MSRRRFMKVGTNIGAACVAFGVAGT
ncbi:twin-arginine translocation signal domain-containing protein [Paraburkholderia hospita]|nr:twin-arginine translocation signal domain-containing protein [Paraburkholderia hospita]